MAEYSRVDTVDEKIRPQLPIACRPHVVAIPSRSYESGLAIGERNKAKLTSFALQMPVEMGGADIVWREFLHWRRLLRYVECQGVWLVPDRNRFDKGSRGENTVPYGANAFSLDLGGYRASHARFEEPVLGRGKFGKRNDM